MHLTHLHPDFLGHIGDWHILALLGDDLDGSPLAFLSVKYSADSSKASLAKLIPKRVSLWTPSGPSDIAVSLSLSLRLGNCFVAGERRFHCYQIRLTMSAGVCT